MPRPLGKRIHRPRVDRPARKFEPPEVSPVHGLADDLFGAQGCADPLDHHVALVVGEDRQSREVLGVDAARDLPEPPQVNRFEIGDEGHGQGSGIRGPGTGCY